MQRGGRRTKIAILGGGVGAMAAAAELTARPDWKDRYEITVYQMGWRLGGKGASGRNPAHYGRIEEHGLHIWFGFYDNAFNLIQRCYDELGRAPDSPLATWSDAFKPQSFTGFEEYFGGRWLHWPVVFPVNAKVPGQGPPAPGPWEYVPRILEQLLDQHARSPYAQAPAVSAAPASPEEKPSWWDHLFPTPEGEVSVAAHGVTSRYLELALRLAGRLDPDPLLHGSIEHFGLLWLLDRFRDWLWREIGSEIAGNDLARRLWAVTDLGITTIFGLIRDGVIHDGFDILNDEEYRAWYRRHGLSEVTFATPLTWAFYDLAFAFPAGDTTKPDAEAGTTLRALLRMVLDYRGAFMWKMQAGMGDTIFTPFYEVLARRGVAFRFFHRVKALHPSADGTTIERIDLGRQATPKNGQYEPLVDVLGLPCWPSEPLYDQLREGEALKEGKVNLESYWTDWPDVESLTLTRGQEFDLVVLGISLGALPIICAELIAANDAWRRMVQHVPTVRTQAFQLWLKPTLAELGWRMPSPVITTYVEPLDTWADMSHLVDRETWPKNLEPGNIAYFCGPMADSPEPPYYGSPEFPATQQEAAKQQALAFLRQDIGHLWPEAIQSGNPALNWQLLIDPRNGQGEARFDRQFWRANVEPPERYVLSVTGSTRHRLKSDASGFANLYLAGDWTRNGLNAGCVEAAVMSGMQVSRAISGFPTVIVGESDLPTDSAALADGATASVGEPR